MSEGRDEGLEFLERVEQHDKRAVAIAEAAFRKHGFILYPFGGELVPDLQKALRHIHNDASRMLRYRPDRVAVKPGSAVFLVEIKSEARGSKNFAVEFDAWDAARLWNRNMKAVIYVFVDLLTGKVYGCFPEELKPKQVFISRISDIKRILKLLPSGTTVRCSRETVGSGTAFFLVAKSKLKLLNELIDIAAI